MTGNHLILGGGGGGLLTRGRVAVGWRGPFNWEVEGGKVKGKKCTLGRRNTL